MELRSRGLLHTTYKVFVVAVLLQSVGLALLCGAYGQYAHDGLGLPKTKLAGKWRPVMKARLFQICVVDW